MLHEVELTQLCLILHAGRIHRGPLIENAGLRPDAEMWIDGELFYLEWDRGTMSYAQVARHRFPKYEPCRQLVLWVCSSQTRRDGLRTRAGSIRHAALFATAADALASPHGEIWLDHGGHRAALPRQSKAPDRQ